MHSGSIVGLKYKGVKKIPFTFRNEHLETKEMSWKSPGDVVDVSLPDAKFMVKYSPSDFDIVFKNVVDAESAIEVPTELPGFVDSEEDKQPSKRGPGRPKINT